MELVQIITRDPKRVLREVKSMPVNDFRTFNREVDVAILCCGSKQDLFNAGSPARPPKSLTSPAQLGQGPFFARLFNTVDSFDTHARIPAYRRCMNAYCVMNRRTAVISAGWDPGTFSLERIMADAFLPGSHRYTFWGPGVSQGHSDAVRRIPGVADCRQYTLPIRSAVARVRRGQNPKLEPGEKHTRLVYAAVQAGADKKRIEHEIKTMPNYFAGFRTRVVFVSRARLLKEHKGFPHSGFVLASGKTGSNKGLIEYRCSWESNPEATASILVACARACVRMNREHKYGAWTMADIPPAYYSSRDGAELLKDFM
jgi:diaminopimelate dehydrogenase